MSTDRLTPPEVDLDPPATALQGSLIGDAQRSKKLRLTAEDRLLRAEAIAGYGAHLEQLPTAELPEDALKRLTLLAIEISASDPLGGEREQTLGATDDSPRRPAKKRTAPRRNLGTQSPRAGVAHPAVQR
jgi:hypothetical protein